MSTVYLGTIDGGGDGKTLLLAAINRELNENYQMSDFDFGEPELVDVVEPTHNTKILFGPKMSSPYYGVRTVFYSRIHASELGNVIVPYNGEVLVSQLLTKINEKYGIYIMPEDIVDRPVPPPTTSNQVMVELEFQPGCIVFYSSTMIQIGQNDPTGDTKPNLPFQVGMLFGVNNHRRFDLAGSDTVVLEPYTLAMGTDNERKRTASLSGPMMGTKGGEIERTRITGQQFDKIKQVLPMVGYYRRISNGALRALAITGDYFELSNDGLTWTWIGNGNGSSSAWDSNVQIAAAFNSPFVKGLAQAANGDVYVLFRKLNEAPAIWKMTGGANTWTKLNFAASRMQCLTAAMWDKIEVLDILHNGDRLWIMIRSDTDYDIHPTKGRKTPSVEMFNTSSLATDYFPLGDMRMRFSDIEMDTSAGRWKIVTPPAQDSVFADAVALIPSKNNDNMYAVQYRHQSVGEYQAYLLPHSYIPRDLAVREELDICGFQLPLTRVPAKQGVTTITTHYLDVVQIIAPSQVDTFDNYFIRTDLRTPKKFYSYGLKTLSCVTTRAARTPWAEKVKPLRGNNKPFFVRMTNDEGTNHVIYQEQTAVHRSMFGQVTGTTTFDVLLDSQAKLDLPVGYPGVSRVAGGKYVKPTIVEYTTPVAELANIQDDEALLSPIGFSFVGTNATGDKVWYTAQTSTELLTPRKPTQNYAFMGDCPALVAAEGSRILYMSAEGNGLFMSSNQGAAWNEFNAFPAFYKQERAYSSRQHIMGKSVVPLFVENFKEGALTGDTFILDVNSDYTYNVVDVNAGNTNTAKNLPDQQLFVVKPGVSGNQYTGSTEQSGFGLNALSQYSPRQVIAWDSDRLGNFESIGRWTNNLANLYDKDWRIENYMFLTTGNIKDFSRDVKYLNTRHFILYENNNVWTLGFTDAVVPTKKVGLYGTTGSPFNTFLPEVNFHLWEYVDDVAQYVPYVFYGGGKVLLLERLENDNTFNVTQHLITVPSDNGNPLKPIKMYTANRRDYWFFQKGNGLFKLTYTYNGVTKVSKVVLTKVFNLNTTQLRDLEFSSGCITGITARQAPMESLIPDELPNGYLIGQYCVNSGTAPYTLVKRFANGTGGWYEESTNNSPECGYVAPVGLMANQGFTSGEDA